MWFCPEVVQVPGNRRGGSASNAPGIRGKSEVIPMRALGDGMPPTLLGLWSCRSSQSFAHPGNLSRCRASAIEPGFAFLPHRTCPAHPTSPAEDVNAERRQGHRPPLLGKEGNANIPLLPVGETGVAKSSCFFGLQRSENRKQPLDFAGETPNKPVSFWRAIHSAPT